MAERRQASTAPRKTTNAKAAAPSRKAGLKELRCIMEDLGWAYDVLEHRLNSRGYALEVVKNVTTKTDLPKKRHATTPVENEKPAKKTKEPEARASKKKSNKGVIPNPPIEPSVRGNCLYEENGISCDRRTCRAWHEDQFNFVDSKLYCAGGYNWRRPVDLPRANMNEVEAKPARTNRDKKNQALFNKYFAKKKSNANRPRYPGFKFRG